MLPIIFSIVFFGVLVMGQEIPNSPCPEVFQYFTEPDGDIFGRITLPYDGSSTLHLGVNASMKGYYTNRKLVKLQIKMNTLGQDIIQHKTNTLSYDLYFPFQHTIPKVTKIEYNQKLYCTGPPEDLLPGTPGVTSLWTGHNYYFQTPNGVAPQISSSPNPLQLTTIPEDNLQNIDQERLPQIITNSVPQQTLPNSAECGVSKSLFVPLILGGKEIGEGMFPWLTAMFTSNGNGYQFKCTANLISDRHVVTAARCVNFYKVQVVKSEDILFVFGKSNLKNWATSGAVTRGASAVNTYPDFNANSGHGDISIITLDQPIEFSSSIAPICLWEDNNSLEDIVDKTGTVAGWGADEGAQKSGHYSISEAKSVDMPVVSQENCLYSNLSYFQLTSDTTFCAGKRDGTGTCIGDSGAGFMIHKNGKFYLRGLASLVLTDKGKCDLSNFMVFCDAAKMTNWIKKTMAN